LLIIELQPRLDLFAPKNSDGDARPIGAKASGQQHHREAFAAIQGIEREQDLANLAPQGQAAMANDPNALERSAQARTQLFAKFVAIASRRNVRPSALLGGTVLIQSAS
jgi:hypothetical protein